MPERPLLWYVHHHGSGHWRRAIAVGRHLTRPVTYASSAPPPSAGVDWVQLPADVPATDAPDTDEPATDAPDTDAPAPDAGQHDATAGGRLHWAPVHHQGLLARHRMLLDLLDTHQPSLAVVDVSVEVALLLRVSGLPVVTVRLPGARIDAPHDLVHAIADGVVLPVPERWEMGAGGGTAVGLVSALPGGAVDLRPDGPVLVLLGSGGSALTPAHCQAIAQAAAGRSVVVAGAEGYDDDTLTWLGRVDDPSQLIAEASVVIGGAGLGTVADVATTGRPFVCVPDDRPFGEQRATAAAIGLHEAACVLDSPPESPAGWATALSTALNCGPMSADSGGAVRFAQLLEAAAR